MADAPLIAYRVLAPDIDILTELVRWLRAMGFGERARKLEILIDRAKNNPYNEGE